MDGSGMVSNQQQKAVQATSYLFLRHGMSDAFVQQNQYSLIQFWQKIPSVWLFLKKGGIINAMWVSRPSIKQKKTHRFFETNAFVHYMKTT